MKDLGFDNLGFINLTIVYATFSLTSIFAVKLAIVLGPIKTMFFSAFTYALWTGCFLLPAYRSENKNETGIFSDGSIVAL
jgi:hypothetical protein